MLSLLWALFCGFVAFSVLGGLLPDMPEEPDPSVIVAIYGVIAVLSIVAGIFQVTAAVSMLRRKRAARKLGIASGVISCMSLWGCCVFPFHLAFGIYSLSVLAGRNAIDVLDA
jgi:hypothetical protein